MGALKENKNHNILLRLRQMLSEMITRDYCHRAEGWDRKFCERFFGETKRERKPRGRRRRRERRRKVPPKVQSPTFVLAFLTVCIHRVDFSPLKLAEDILPKNSVIHSR